MSILQIIRWYYNKKTNYSEPWASLITSHLFRPDKCFYCKRDTNINADISLADPWLPNYLNNDTIGHSIIIRFSAMGQNVIDNMVSLNHIDIRMSSYSEYAVAQKPNLEKADKLKKYKSLIKIEILLKNNRCYKKIASYNLQTIRIHNKFIKMLYLLFNWINK